MYDCEWPDRQNIPVKMLAPHTHTKSLLLFASVRLPPGGGERALVHVAQAVLTAGARRTGRIIKFATCPAIDSQLSRAR